MPIPTGIVSRMSARRARARTRARCRTRRSSASAAASACREPSRCERNAAGGAKRPMQRTGIVPSRPATACEVSRSSWIAGISGPMPTSCGRSASAARKSAARRARLGSDDGVRDRAEAVDLDRDLVARLQPDRRLAEGADAGGRPGDDQVARLERDRLRDERRRPRRRRRSGSTCSSPASSRRSGSRGSAAPADRAPRSPARGRRPAGTCRATCRAPTGRRRTGGRARRRRSRRRSRARSRARRRRRRRSRGARSRRRARPRSRGSCRSPGCGSARPSAISVFGHFAKSSGRSGRSTPCSSAWSR